MRKLLSLLGGIVIAAPFMMGATVCSSVTTLQGLINLGSTGCDTATTNFSGFSYEVSLKQGVPSSTPSGLSGTTNAAQSATQDPALIGLALNGTGFDYTSTGLPFKAGKSTAGTGSRTVAVTLTYLIKTINPLVYVSTADFGINSFSANLGNASSVLLSAQKDVCVGAAWSSGSCAATEVLDAIDLGYFKDSGSTTSNLTGSYTFPSSTSVVGVRDTILMTVTNGTTGTIQFNGFSQTFTTVPEPATIALSAAGLLGLALARRRRKSA